MARTDIDWEKIELQYRAGILTLREMGLNHNLAESAIRKRAKRDEWSRDLAAKIKAKSDDLVRKNEVRKIERGLRTVTETREIAIGAELVSNVRLTHRGDIRRAKDLTISLLAELELETSDIQLFRELGAMLRSEDKNGQDKRNDLYQKVISSAGRISSMKTLSDTLKTLITLEREAYSISTDPSEAREQSPSGLGHFYGGDD